MLIECLLIIAIIVSIIVMSLKNHKNAAVEATPLLAVPVMYVVANYASFYVAKLIPANTFTTFSALIVIAIVISSMMTGFLANRFKRKRAKALYVSTILIFDVLLGAILIFNMYEFLM